MRAVLDTPGLEIPRYHPVRAFIGSGMSAELSRRVGETFDAQEVEFYASTEGEIVLAKVRGGKPGAKGRRLPGSADVALVDYYFDSGRFVEDGDGFLQEVGDGEVGVLIGRADPDVTHRDVLLRGVFRPGDAWFSTGHLFRRDEDGDYWLVDDVRTVAVTDRGPVYSIPITDVLEQLKEHFELIVIDTPPHADLAASKAAECADLVLIPCRPSAFDLAAMRTTIRLVELLSRPAFVVFTAGPPTAPHIYADARELVAGFGGQTCPIILPDRAAYRHAVAGGQTVFELGPRGKAASEIEQLHMWTCEQLHMSTRPQTPAPQRKTA